MKDAARLAQSPAARQLLAAMQAQDPEAISRAMTSAAAGNYAQAQQDLAALLSSPEVQALLNQLGS